MMAFNADISVASPHPLPIRLAAFGLGKLDEGESALISEHISTCNACRLLVESVADDSLAGLFREVHGRADTRAPIDVPITIGRRR